MQTIMAGLTVSVTELKRNFAGILTQPGAAVLSSTKSGVGTQTLSGTNTYTGATTVNAGTLQAGAVNVLGSTSGLTLNGAGSTFNLAGFDQQVGKLDGAGGTIVTNSAGNSGDSGAGTRSSAWFKTSTCSSA